jgi:hypothetical protein
VGAQLRDEVAPGKHPRHRLAHLYGGACKRLSRGGIRLQRLERPLDQCGQLIACYKLLYIDWLLSMGVVSVPDIPAEVMEGRAVQPSADTFEGG